METKKFPKVTKSFHCESCDYTCSKKSLWEKHCSTRKHQILINPNKILTEDIPTFECACGKTYKHNSSLSAHKKKCGLSGVSSVDSEPAITAEMFMKVLDDNKELRNLLCMQQEQIKEQQKQMAELLPKIGSGNTTNNNQRFNLQFFLNETCREAINWDDFVKSIEVGAKEFEDMTSTSMTEGVAKVICHGIQDLGLYKRPIHCVDVKRRKMCIKEEDAWNHDEQEVDGMLHKATVSTKGKYNQILCQWEKDHPDWQQDEDETETYLHLLGKIVESTDEKKCAIEIARNSVIPKEA